ncbi:eukaryotic integral membrane protein-domain-containing protein [Umbelopsis sp. AD052]|nr:eukaryotic integral membrane protein-domain-containing protein [Umbelopsis sp. AD052]
MSSQKLKTVVTNVPPVTRALTAAIIITSGIGLLITYTRDPEATTHNNVPVIGLVPGYWLHFPWTFLTACLYENNIFAFITSLVATLLGGKYLERAWGSKELLKFVIVTGVIPNILTWLTFIVPFYITGDDDFLFNYQINGMTGVLASFLVAFRHLIPEHLVQVFGGTVSIRVKNLLGILTAATIVSLILFQTLVVYNLVNLGWVVAWAYLRFFKWQDGVQGDRSETFALYTFFPDFLHTPIKAVSNIVFGILVALKCCKPFPPSWGYDLEGQASTSRSTPGPLPGSARAEAERRRALALKALDIRLSSKHTPSPTGSPAPTYTSQSPQTSASQQNDPVLFDAGETMEATSNVDGDTVAIGIPHDDDKDSN